MWWWASSRRAQLAALCVCACAAMLLLHAPRAGPRPYPAPRSAPAPRNVTTITTPAPPPADNDTTPADNDTTPAHPAPPPPPPSRDPRVILTGNVYVAGHSRPRPERCPALGANLRLLVLVTSAPGHAAERDAVRLTWGHVAVRRDVGFAFVLGAADGARAAALRAENELYGDIIIGNSRDSYSNLTLKTLSMLEWVDTYCPRVPRLLKTDDDMFINIPRLLRFIDARRNATRTIWGHVMKRTTPRRSTESKFYVSPLQYAQKVFPDYATGAAYLLTTDVVGALLRAAPAEPYLCVEDVFFTGVLASKLRVRRIHVPEFYIDKVYYHPCTVQTGIAIHQVCFHRQFDLWRKLLDGKTKCAGT